MNKYLAFFLLFVLFIAIVLGNSDRNYYNTYRYSDYKERDRRNNDGFVVLP